MWPETDNPDLIKTLQNSFIKEEHLLEHDKTEKSDRNPLDLTDYLTQTSNKPKNEWRSTTYSLITSVSILLLPALGDDIFS